MGFKRSRVQISPARFSGEADSISSAGLFEFACSSLNKVVVAPYALGTMKTETEGKMRIELRAEVTQPGLARERFIHPIAEHHDIRRPLREQFFQVPDITLRPQPAAHCITRPRETAKAQLHLRSRALHARFEFAALAKPPDHRPAVKEHGVVCLERERRRIGSAARMASGLFIGR